jgi:hypothetical protein
MSKGSGTIATGWGAAPVIPPGRPDAGRATAHRAALSAELAGHAIVVRRAR